MPSLWLLLGVDAVAFEELLEAAEVADFEEAVAFVLSCDAEGTEDFEEETVACVEDVPVTFALLSAFSTACIIPLLLKVAPETASTLVDWLLIIPSDTVE